MSSHRRSHPPEGSTATPHPDPVYKDHDVVGTLVPALNQLTLARPLYWIGMPQEKRPWPMNQGEGSSEPETKRFCPMAGKELTLNEVLQWIKSDEFFQSCPICGEHLNGYVTEEEEEEEEEEGKESRGDQRPKRYRKATTDTEAQYPVACRHMFHMRCLRSWIRTQNGYEKDGQGVPTCPECRSVITQTQNVDFTTLEPGERCEVYDEAKALKYRIRALFEVLILQIKAAYLGGVIQILNDYLELWSPEDDKKQHLKDFLARVDDEEGMLPLYHAARKGSLEVVQLLVTNGANVCAEDEYAEAENDDGDYSLRCAARNGHLKVVEYLVEQGAYIGDWAVLDAAENGHLDVVQYLMEQKADDEDGLYNSVLQHAAEYGHLAIVEYALNKDDVDVHAEFDYALRSAAKNGHLPVVKYLVEECKADVHAANDDALRYAAQYGRFEMVKTLVDHGANVHAENDEALRYAAENGHLEVVKYLVERGANVQAEKNYALRYAAENGHLEVVRYLVEKSRSEVHAKEYEALRRALQKGHLEIVRYLVEHGTDARVKAQASRWNTIKGNIDLVSYLRGLTQNPT